MNASKENAFTKKVQNEQGKTGKVINVFGKLL